MSTQTPLFVSVPPTDKRLLKAYREGLEHGQSQIADGRKNPVENYNRANPYSSFSPGVECRVEWRSGYFAAFGLPSPQ